MILLIIVIIVILIILMIALISHLSIKHVTTSNKPEDKDIEHIQSVIHRLQLCKVDSSDQELNKKIDSAIEIIKDGNVTSSAESKEDKEIEESVLSLESYVSKKKYDDAIHEIDTIMRLAKKRNIICSK